MYEDENSHAESPMGEDTFFEEAHYNSPKEMWDKALEFFTNSKSRVYKSNLIRFMGFTNGRTFEHYHKNVEDPVLKKQYQNVELKILYRLNAYWENLLLDSKMPTVVGATKWLENNGIIDDGEEIVMGWKHVKKATPKPKATKKKEKPPKFEIEVTDNFTDDSGDEE